MKRPDARLVAGALLILGGLLLLPQSLGLFPVGMGLLWAVFFGLGGLAFMFYFVIDRHNTWWAAIPGFSMLGLGATIFLSLLPLTGPLQEGLLGSTFLGSIGLSFLLIFLVRREFWWALIPGGILLALSLLVFIGNVLPNGEDLIGPLFLAFIGLAFLAVFVVRRDQWWAIIPAGMMLTLAITISIDILSENFSVGLMMLGFAATFALVGILPTRHGPNSWAFIPAALLGLIGMIFLASMESIFRYSNIVGSLALILAGGYLIFRNVLRRPRGE